MFRQFILAPRVSAALIAAATLCTATSCQRPAGPVATDAAGTAAHQDRAATAEATGRLSSAGTTAPAGGFDQSAHNRLSVLSFNMQHRDRPNELAVMAENLLMGPEPVPDFILCQEVLFKRAKRKGAENTAAVLADLMGFYSQGTRRKTDREGVAIVSRYPFTYYDERHLKHRTTRLLFGFSRVSVMGEFLVPEVGRVRVVGVHLAHLPFEHSTRRKQLRETLDWIESRQRWAPADVTFLGGDFNITLGRKELSLVRNSDLGFQDCNSTEPTKGSKGSPDKRVDYIFVSARGRNVEMVGEHLLWKKGLMSKSGSRHFWLSDHVPLLHEYAVGGGRSFAWR